MDPKPLFAVASDAANVAVTPFSVHILFATTQVDGETTPQGTVMVSIAFARFLHRLLGQALDVVDGSAQPTPPALEES